MDTYVYPAEATYREQVEASGDPFFHPPVMEELKKEAQERSLWNLFLPDEHFGAGLTNLEYAPLAEITGRSHIAPEALNCAAPDTGNMEILAAFGTPEQQHEWLEPLLAGEIRSCFSMTEPEVASSDATTMQSRIERDGDSYLINGHKWWTSGAAAERCKISIFMGVTDPEAEPHKRHSMVLVPLDTPGVNIVRTLPVFGYDTGHGGHCEVIFDNVRVPAENMLGEEGGGFAIAQSRLGPGRIHHCMRAIGMAERAFDLMCERAHTRFPFGKSLARQGVVQNWIAESRIEIEQTRLLVLKTAWLMDTAGNKGARIEVSAIKVAAPELAVRVIDRAIQVHGGGGVSDDFPLAAMYAHARTLRIADGPDEVHKMAIAKRELHRYQPREPVSA
jgi:acyl-CoA dehydrogenase